MGSAASCAQFQTSRLSLATWLELTRGSQSLRACFPIQNERSPLRVPGANTCKVSTAGPNLAHSLCMSGWQAKKKKTKKKTAFTFPRHGKLSKEEYRFVTSENDMKFKFQCP